MMGYFSPSCGLIEVRINIASNINVYVTTKWGYCNVFQENMHLISQSVFLETLVVMWTLQLSGVYYLTEDECLEVQVKMLDFLLLSYQRGFSNSGLDALDIHIVSHIPYTWLSTYDRKLWHKTTRMFPVTTSFSL
jgi:hypothetical protein